MRRALSFLFLLFVLLACAGENGANEPSGDGRAPSETPTPAGSATEYPILFVTQIPIPEDFATVASTFGNHRADLYSAGRGGDLWIRYPDGELKNLTRAAGYGDDALQGDNAISVRDPEVHWDGTKAIFSMVMGGPSRLYEYEDYYWQLFEITGLGKDDLPVVTKVPGQPETYNNLSPTYLSDDSIVFTSDLPFNRQAHLYPQLDEYEMTPTNTGLWHLDPGSAQVTLYDHSPSGNFTPLVDSFGRIVFTRWDHLQRDQMADADAYLASQGQACQYCTFNYSSEAVNSVPTISNEEIFPEKRPDNTYADELASQGLAGHRFNHFMPWMINQDGTGLETLNHIGRHELHSYFPVSRVDDDNLQEWYYDPTNVQYPSPYARSNSNNVQNVFQMSEDPSQPGRYLGTNAPEFFTHSAGQLVALNALPGTPADDIVIEHLTHPATAEGVDPEATPPAEHSGLWRDPVALTNGTLVAADAGTALYEYNYSDSPGSRERPQSRYSFRLRELVKEGDYYVGGGYLTGGISKDITYYSPDFEVTYSGDLWELQPVELRPRSRPPTTNASLPQLEQNVFSDVGVSLSELKRYLRDNDLALVVSRDVTVRDDGDKQQPFNLRVAGTATESVGAAGKVYDVSYMQFFEAQLLRGREGTEGRRPIAQIMDASLNSSAGPEGSVALGSDGSMAAFVPAGRALSWQLTDETGNGVVLERNWLTFQAGEVRVCASCHGLSGVSQTGTGEPENEPEALRDLLSNWKNR